MVWGVMGVFLFFFFKPFFSFSNCSFDTSFLGFLHMFYFSFFPYPRPLPMVLILFMDDLIGDGRKKERERKKQRKRASSYFLF